MSFPNPFNSLSSPRDDESRHSTLYEEISSEEDDEDGDELDYDEYQSDTSDVECGFRRQAQSVIQRSEKVSDASHQAKRAKGSNQARGAKQIRQADSAKNNSQANEATSLILDTSPVNERESFLTNLLSAVQDTDSPEAVFSSRTENSASRIPPPLAPERPLRRVHETTEIVTRIFDRVAKGMYWTSAQRKGLTESLPSIASPFVRAPVLTSSFRDFCLEQSPRAFHMKEHTLAIIQQMVLESSNMLTIALDEYMRGNANEAQLAMIWALKFNANASHELTVMRRANALREINPDLPGLVPAFRALALSNELHEDQWSSAPPAPVLFDRELTKQVIDLGKGNSDRESLGVLSALASKARRGGGAKRVISTTRFRPFKRSRSDFCDRNVDVGTGVFENIIPPHHSAGCIRFFLANWRKLTRDPAVLQIVKGYRLDFVSDPGLQVCRPQPIRFAEHETVLVDNEVASLLERRAVEPVPDDDLDRIWVSRLFLVPKKTGELRPIINLRPLNRFLRYEHFKMENLSFLKDIIRPSDFLAKLDMKDAYHGAPIHRNDRRFLSFEWKGNFYQFTCLPFGLSPSPRVYTKLMKPVVSFLRQSGLRTIVYLDDWLFLNESDEGLQQDLNFALFVFRNLGLQVNFPKSILSPCQQLEFLGVVVDTVSMLFSVSEEKLVRVEQECENLLRTTAPTALQLAKILGRFNSLSQAILPATLYSRSLQGILNEAVSQGNSYDVAIVLSKAAIRDLRVWLEHMRFWNGRPILPASPDTLITSDASNLGWGAWSGSVSTGGRWSSEELSWHINAKELFAAFLAIKCFAKDRTDSQLLLQLDNSTAVAYINKQGGTKSSKLCSLATELWEWCLQRRITVLAVHIPGSKNVIADSESRMHVDSSDWMIDRKSTRNLFRILGQCNVDLFASRTNYQIDRYVAWRPDPGAWATDAFALNWSAVYGYAFPPFALIGRCLQKVLSDRAEIVLIAPVWPTQPWWPLILAMAIDHPLLIPTSVKLLRAPDGSPHPLILNGSLSLAAWKISGISWKAAVFRQKLPKLSSTRGPTALSANTTQPSKSGIAGVCRSVLIRFRRLWID